jgi:hypothetical protein
LARARLQRDGASAHLIMGSSGPRRRKPKKTLPPVPKYVPYPRHMRHARLGGPLTSDHEAEALAAQRARPVGRLGRFVVRLLGGRSEPRP